MAGDKRAARLGVLAAVAVMLFGALGTRLWFLQTVQASDLQAEVDARNTETVLIAPERGQIFDTDGRLVAGNEATLNVVVQWEAVRRDSDRAELFRRLSGWIDQPVEVLEERYDAERYSRLRPLPLAEDVGEDVAVALKERIEDFPGVSVQPGYRRIYPYAPLASHVIGYMGAITIEDKAEYEELGYDTSSVGEDVGRAGVELSYEQQLHGQWGEITYQVDSHGQIIRELSRTEAVNGNDIQLSIDLDLQQYAERLLQTKLQLQRAFTAPNPIIEDPFDGSRHRMDLNSGPVVHYEAPAGSVIVMNHATGQIVAMASYPTFDNRWFSQDLSGDKIEELFSVRIDTPECGDEGQPVCRQDPDEAMLNNRAIQGQYNLGSSFKPFVAWSALNTGLIGANDWIEDSGTYKATSIEDEVCAAGIKCVWRNSTCNNAGPCVYGNIDMQTALAVSSDVYFYRLGELFYLAEGTNHELLQQQVAQFGFGLDTGIDLPYEFEGRIPDQATKADLVARGVLAEGEEPRVLVGDVINVSIGQGLLAATPMQVAVAYGTLANGGYRMVPRVVQAIYEPGTPAGATGFVDLTRAVPAGSPLGPVGTPVAMPEGADAIRAGLRRNILGPGANGRSTTAEELFFNYPDSAIPIAGKTGTAQGRFSYPWNDSSVFGAFSIDGENPYTIVAYLEKSGFGSRGAGPVVKCLFLALSDPATLDPVSVSEPLDPTDTVASHPYAPVPTGCMESSDANTVYPGPVDAGRPVD